MNNDKSIFNISIIELILILFFMFIVLSVYQLSFKDTHINELEKTVESQREVTQELVKKEYPKLENKIGTLVDLEKYKKLYEELMKKNSGIYFIENNIIDGLKNTEKLKDYKEYEELIKVKNQIHNQILELKSNKLTVNTLNELNIQSQPLHRQIQYLEKKVRDNYQNKLILANRLKDLKTNETVKYILLKLDKYNAPIQEQLDAINAELKKFDKTLLNKNYNIKRDYNSNTKYVLKNVNYENKPLNNQIKVLKHVLENQKMIQKIKILENQLENNQKARNYSVDINNTQQALKNLQNIKNNITGQYDANTKDLIKELKYDKKPLDAQISELKKQLELGKKVNELKNKINNLQRELDKNSLQIPNINNENIQKALKNLQDIKNNTTSKYEPNTNKIIQELKQNDKPLNEQISELKKQLELKNKNKDLENTINDLKRELEQNSLENPKINNENIQKALDNLQDIKNDAKGKYDKETKNLLKKLEQNNKPLDEQIAELKKQLDLANKTKDLEKQIKDLENKIDKNIILNNPNINNENIQNALDNLQNIKNNTSLEYEPKTKEILKKLNQDNKPLDNQINELKKQLELNNEGKKLEDKIKDLKNKLDESRVNNPNINDEKIQKVLDKQIKDLQKELDKKEKEKNPNVSREDIQKALDNLQNIKNNSEIKFDPETKEILKQLNQDSKPIDEQINNLKKEQELAKEAKELENQIKELEDKLDKNKLNNPNINNENIQKALNNLQDIKNDKNAEYKPRTKEILRELKQDNKPIDEQVSRLEKELERAKQAKDIENQIKDIQKELAKNKKQRNPKVTDGMIQKALDSLENIKQNTSETTPSEKIYLDKLQDALDGLKKIQKIKDQLSNDRDYKPEINKEIEQTIKYLEDKSKQPNLKPSKEVLKVLDRFKIKGKPTNDQLSDLYLNLYSTPVDNTNISELNFVINRLNDQDELENRIERINEVLKDINRPKNSFLEDYVSGTPGTNNEIRTLKNQVKYLQKKIEKSGKLHLPCILDDDGKTLYLFKLFLREENIYVELGWQDGVAQIAKDLPNMDSLVNKTLKLDEFMDLTKPIFEKSIQDECRQFVYFEDETISKKEYKRKTLTIEHHFYKYIEAIW